MPFLRTFTWLHHCTLFLWQKTGNFGPCLRKRHHKLQLLSKGSRKKSLPKGNTIFPPMKGIWYIDPAHIFWVYISAGVIWWEAEWCASVHTMTMHIWLHFKIIQRPKLGRASPELKQKKPVQSAMVWSVLIAFPNNYSHMMKVVRVNMLVNMKKTWTTNMGTCPHFKWLPSCNKFRKYRNNSECMTKLTTKHQI